MSISAAMQLSGCSKREISRVPGKHQLIKQESCQMTSQEVITTECKIHCDAVFDEVLPA